MSPPPPVERWRSLPTSAAAAVEGVGKYVMRRGDGYAPVSVDNVGVQYGLAALARGQIDADEFLRLNACIGGWKEQSDFVDWDMKNDPFDARNMRKLRRKFSCRKRTAGRLKFFGWVFGIHTHLNRRSLGLDVE